jgi:hypothetical protein
MVKCGVFFEVRIEFSNIISLNSISKLIFAMVKCGVIFELRTELLSIIYMRLGFEGLNIYCTRSLHV